MKLKRNVPQPPPGRRRAGIPERPSNPAFSYYTQRSERSINTGRQAGRSEAPVESRAISALRYIVQRGGLLVLLIAVLIFLLSSLSLSTSPRILPLRGNKSDFYLRSNAVYSQAASDILGGSFWDHNKLTINTASLEEKLKATFPELSQVVVTLPLINHRPLIYLETSPPALILNTSSSSFIVSDDGKAVLDASQLPSSVHLSLPVVTDQTGLQAHVNDMVLTHSDARFIEIVSAELSARHLAVAGMVLPRAASELDVHLTGLPYFVKFNMQPGYTDARQQAGTFIAVYNKLAGEHITPASYIDVRIDGRAYYK